MTLSPSAFIKGAVSLLAGLGVTLKAFFQPVVTSQYPRELLTISPRFRGHTKLLADKENPEKNACTACQICVKACPSGSIVKVDGEKREGEKRKTGTYYLLDFTTCSQCGICVEVCPFDALDFSADFNLVGYKREDFHFDLVKEFEKRKKAS
jgi:NADH-quinone oxidoreductase chain I